MSLKATWFRDKLRKKAKRGFQGLPMATITYYGPNDQRASKVAVGVIRDREAMPTRSDAGSPTPSTRARTRA